jgi:Ran GTPase-activating protein (RanGAP) involved in mRNA processing and transport
VEERYYKCEEELQVKKIRKSVEDGLASLGPQNLEDIRKISTRKNLFAEIQQYKEKEKEKEEYPSMPQTPASQSKRPSLSQLPNMASAEEKEKGSDEANYVKDETMETKQMSSTKRASLSDVSKSGARKASPPGDAEFSIAADSKIPQSPISSSSETERSPGLTKKRRSLFTLSKGNNDAESASNASADRPSKPFFSLSKAAANNSNEKRNSKSIFDIGSVAMKLSKSKERDRDVEDDGKISPGDVEYSEKISSEMQQIVVHCDRVKMLENEEMKNRLIILLSFRLLIIRKDTVKGRVIKHNYHLLDLIRFCEDNSNNGKFNLVFKADQKTEEFCAFLEGSQVKSFVSKIIGTYNKIANLVSSSKTLTIEISNEAKGFIPVSQIDEKMAKDAVLTAYNLVCDYLQVKPRARVLKYFELSRLRNGKNFNISKIFKGQENIDELDLYAASWSMRNLKIFREVTCIKFNLGDSAMNALGMLLHKHTTIEAIRIEECNLSSKGIYHLTKAMQNMISEMRLNGIWTSPLKVLNLSLNSIGDEGAILLASALQHPILLEVLSLRDCNISYKGISAICKLGTQDNLSFSHLKQFDISGNNIGNTGSKYLADFLRHANLLESLNIADCDVNLKVIFQAIFENEALSIKSLKALNVSGNKSLSSGSLFGDIISRTCSLDTIILSNTKISKTILQELICSIILNSSKCQFYIDISNNSFEANTGKILLKALKGANKDTITNIRAVVMNNCKLGSEGMSNMLDFFASCPSIEALLLDQNCSTASVFSSDSKLGAVFSQSMRYMKNLKILSLKGSDGNVLGENILQLFEFLKSNETIESLDLSQNRMSSDAWRAACEMIRCNRHIRYLNLDGNLESSKSLKSYHDAVLKNMSLFGTLPVADINEIRSSSKKNEELFKLCQGMFNQYKNNKLNNEYRITESFLKISHLAYYTKYNEFLDFLTHDSQSKVQFGLRIALVNSVKIEFYASPIPEILIKMEKYLFSHDAISTIGIFRIAPDKSIVESVKNELNNGEFKSCEDIHCISHLIKVWFRDCPEKLLSDIPVKEIVNCTKSKDSIRESFEKLAEPKKSIFLWLLDLCVKISSSAQKNLMSSKNLAIVFSPNLHVLESVDPQNRIRVSEELTLYVDMCIAFRAEERLNMSCELPEESLLKSAELGEVEEFE